MRIAAALPPFHDFSSSVSAFSRARPCKAQFHPTPTLWSALLLCGALVLQGAVCCRPARAEPAAAVTTEDQPAFSLEVKAPDSVRDTLERHLELQRFRLLPDLQNEELRRLLHAADANARELLGTLGYFAPTIAIELREAAAPQPPYAVTHRGARPADASRRPTSRLTGGRNQARCPRVRSCSRVETTGRCRRQPFTQGAWSDAKTTGCANCRPPLPHRQHCQQPRRVDADTHEAKLAVTTTPARPTALARCKLRGSQRYDPTVRAAWPAFPPAACTTKQKCSMHSSAWPTTRLLRRGVPHAGHRGPNPQAAP